MTTEDRIQALERCVDELADRLGRVEDELAIRRLQHAYGYFMDKCLYEEVVELFSDRGETYFLGGVFKGRAGVRRLYCGRLGQRFVGGKNRPTHGLLLDHLLLQDVITVAPDRLSAKARYRCFMQGGSHESVPEIFPPFWEAGVYENTYLKEDGVWKIGVLNYNVLFYAPYDQGWGKVKPGYAVPAFSKTYPEDPNGPDELTSRRASFWPENEVVPFHYVHPVTGKPVR
ncbi:MAG TPA: nuclear transport factor 2 family protein [Candidatus Acidoferrum sp.]|nr:nuclear transport factor 2 family protein [Candidatus Acidoferrum sp.]